MYVDQGISNHEEFVSIDEKIECSEMIEKWDDCIVIIIIIKKKEQL